MFSDNRVHPTPHCRLKCDTYKKDRVEEMIVEVSTADERMFDELTGKLMQSTFLSITSLVGLANVWKSYC